MSNQAKMRVACRHHWVIEGADGPVSIGACKLCGARKEFKNFLPDCLRATQEEYEEWLVRQRESVKTSKTKGDATEVEGE